MSTNALIVLGEPLSGSLRRQLAQVLIWRPARAIARLVVAGLEYRLRRQTYLALSALDDRMLADIGLHKSEINSVIHERTIERFHPNHPMH